MPPETRRVSQLTPTTDPSLADHLLDWLCAPICPLCLGRADCHGLCRACRQVLPGRSRHCRICAATLPQNNAMCGACLVRRPAFDRVVAAFPYAPPIDRLIRGIKYAGHHCDIRPLALSAIARFKHRGLTAPDCFVPVPLDRARLRARGFNQAAEFARFLARHFNARTEWRGLEKPLMRPPQTTLPAGARRRNARGAYLLHHIPDADHVVIVDDVMTTGATVNEIAYLLRRAGIRRIEVWVIARAGDTAA